MLSMDKTVQYTHFHRCKNQKQKTAKEKITIVATKSRNITVKRRKPTAITIGKPFLCKKSSSCTSNTNQIFYQHKALSSISTNDKQTTATKSFIPIQRRAGLVRRTHSPTNVPSPVAKTVSASFTFRSSNPPYFSMGSNAISIGSLASNLLPRSTGIETTATKKRKRCHSPKPLDRSRSQPPIGRCASQEISTKERCMEVSSAVNMKIVSPTLQGVIESAKILRCGIFSFPTETMYSLVSFVPFKRRKIQQLHRNQSCQWDTLLHIKRRDEIRNPQASLTNPPSLYLHRSDYANHFVSHTKRKTFVFKQQIAGADENEEIVNKFTAVSFSESHEVLKRLTSSFWPGPVTIFAPVKRLRSGSSSSFSAAGSSSEDNDSFQHQSKSSCSSLISLASDSTDDQPPTLSMNDCVETSPMLPLTALKRKEELLGIDDIESTTYFIGMRCPSHPLARRILTEVYRDQDIKATDSPSKPRKRLGAVIGFDACINGPTPFSCRDVCSNLLSLQDSAKLSSSYEEKPTIHVMNGEDRREMFAVPASQYGQSSLISLLIDTPNRTIFLLRNSSHLQDANHEVELSADDVKRALRHQGVDDSSSITSKAITAVMNKWDVIEKTV